MPCESWPARLALITWRATVSASSCEAPSWASSATVMARRRSAARIGIVLSAAGLHMGHGFRAGPHLAALNALDRLDDGGVGRNRDAELGRLGDDEPVHVLDLGAAALRHVLAHGGALLVGADLDGVEQFVLAGI